ncbi:MAG TPA: hypothetical protein VJM12_10790 [Pyrinomonadaceae bacterium]|nr:hypothetical protein [Pyrinomonadaceae bacterium]
MDTTQFRCAISPAGARALATEARPDDEEAKNICKQHEAWVPLWSSSMSPETASAYKYVVAWLGLLLFFLPLNLAMVSSAAGALGALGNKANLEHDPAESELQGGQTGPNLNGDQAPTKSRDDSNPIMSGLLRGLFLYLFFISGLLLFDDKPFSSPGPGQYIRLAGFISLISFLVNYRPHLFATIFDWAFERINSRKLVPARARKEETKAEITVEETAAVDEKKTVPVLTPKAAVNGDGDGRKATITEERL